MTSNTVRPHTERTRPAKSRVIFLGSSVSFSKRLLDTFQLEFKDVDFVLVGNLSELSQLTQSERGAVLVIVEEDRIPSMIKHTEAYFNAAGNAKLIASYFDNRPAVSLLSARLTSDQLKSVGFLPLNVQVDVWISVMHLLLCGEVFFASELIDQSPPASNGGPVSAKVNQAKLTPREWEVLKLVASGMQNKNIASDMSLSQHTIKLHIHNILKKIGVSNRTCAASWYNTSILSDPNRDGQAQSSKARRQ